MIRNDMNGKQSSPFSILGFTEASEGDAYIFNSHCTYAITINTQALITNFQTQLKYILISTRSNETTIWLSTMIIAKSQLNKIAKSSRKIKGLSIYEYLELLPLSWWTLASTCLKSTPCCCSLIVITSQFTN